jgi:hypothetical protein
MEALTNQNLALSSAAGLIFSTSRGFFFPTFNVLQEKRGDQACFHFFVAKPAWK